MDILQIPLRNLVQSTAHARYLPLLICAYFAESANVRNKIGRNALEKQILVENFTIYNGEYFILHCRFNFNANYSRRNAP